jgi:hypothetical protein
MINEYGANDKGSVDEGEYAPWARLPCLRVGLRVRLRPA